MNFGALPGGGGRQALPSLPDLFSVRTSPRPGALIVAQEEDSNTTDRRRSVHSEGTVRVKALARGMGVIPRVGGGWALMLTWAWEVFRRAIEAAGRYTLKKALGLTGSNATWKKCG